MNLTTLLILGAAAYLLLQKKSVTPTGILPTIPPATGTAVPVSTTTAAPISTTIPLDTLHVVPPFPLPTEPGYNPSLPAMVHNPVQWSTPLAAPYTSASYSYYGPNRQHIFDYLQSLPGPQPESTWTAYLNAYAGTAFVDDNTNVVDFVTFWNGPASNMLNPQGIVGLAGWQV